MKKNISLYILGIYPVYREIEIYKEIRSMDLNMEGLEELSHVEGQEVWW